MFVRITSGISCRTSRPLSKKGADFMKALIELEITGDFEEPLSNDSIIDILNCVVCDGAENVCLNASYKIIQVYKEEKK